MYEKDNKNTFNVDSYSEKKITSGFSFFIFILFKFYTIM